jgi:DNA-binding MarR family transcriptional regulator
MYDWEMGDPTFNAWVRLRQAWDAMRKSWEIELEAAKTSSPQIDILMILSVSKAPLTTSQIASYVFRELHTVSGLLTRMEKAGYVKKVRSRKDQRVVQIRIQPKGEEVLRQTVGSGFAYAYRIMKAALSEEEIRQLDQSLKKLRDSALQDIGMQTEPLPDSLDARRMLSLFT